MDLSSVIWTWPWVSLWSWKIRRPWQDERPEAVLTSPAADLGLRGKVGKCRQLWTIPCRDFQSLLEYETFYTWFANVIFCLRLIFIYKVETFTFKPRTSSGVLTGDWEWILETWRRVNLLHQHIKMKLKSRFKIWISVFKVQLSFQINLPFSLLTKTRCNTVPNLHTISAVLRCTLD